MSITFEEYLKNGESAYRQIALTSRSYKNIDHSLTDKNINPELGTYGDALLKLALCKILFEESVEKITEKKKDYESDKVLVKIIAHYYDLLKYMHFDYNDRNIPQNYDYQGNENSPKSKHKYIATAAEALLAAIYLDEGENFDLVLDIVKEWKAIIDRSPKN